MTAAELAEWTCVRELPPDGLHVWRIVLSGPAAPAEPGRVWNAKAGDQLLVLRYRKFDPAGAMFTPDGDRIVSWAWASIPFSALWAVRSDGKLLCCTYLPEHDMIAWSLHETDGEVESVETITEDGEDRVYMIVNRTIAAQASRQRSRS